MEYCCDISGKKCLVSFSLFSLLAKKNKKSKHVLKRGCVMK